MERPWLAISDLTDAFQAAVVGHDAPRILCLDTDGTLRAVLSKLT